LDEILWDMSGRNGGGVFALSLLLEDVKVKRGDAQMFCAGFGGGV
jgi:hypothetical protein